MQPILPVPYMEKIDKSLSNIISDFIQKEKLSMEIRRLKNNHFLCFVKKEDNQEIIPIHVFRPLISLFSPEGHSPSFENVLADHFLQFSVVTEAGDIHRWIEFAKVHRLDNKSKIIYQYLLMTSLRFMELLGEEIYDRIINEIRESEFFKERVIKK